MNRPLSLPSPPLGAGERVGEGRVRGLRFMAPMHALIKERRLPVNLTGKAAQKTPALQTLCAGGERQQLASAFGMRASLAPLFIRRSFLCGSGVQSAKFLFRGILSPSGGEREGVRGDLEIISENQYHRLRFRRWAGFVVVFRRLTGRAAAPGTRGTSRATPRASHRHSFAGRRDGKSLRRRPRLPMSSGSCRSRPLRRAPEQT
jgi:hypothetical protein